MVKKRLETFIDEIISVIHTIVILEIKIPDGVNIFPGKRK
ncbi:TMEM175 family protein [Ferruginibacter sp.]